MDILENALKLILVRQKEYLEMSKNSVTEEKYEVGDVIRVSDGAAPAYLITMCMPEKNPSYYLSIASNGSTATIWKGLIKEKVGHIDMEGIFMQMEHDLLVGGE